ncbi:TrmH family RNA methyltransferase [Robertkochia solimangrovi]|uniref:TrmH family RNA methyltransferase n=1 Tax=Robertkochia solimangrovi TaxID=2213046 RepID=UPI00117E455D|nr:RNA methyltransferase [Robertkochia solimangrovi]TRZ43643.1 TrmH family RNA methyltransferase [Robertkochia solimangrovi]
MSASLLSYLQGFITEERMERIEAIMSLRTNHFTIAIEDVFQFHNTSAVIRSCDVFGVQHAHVIEERFGKRLDKNIAMGAQKWVDVHRYDTTSTCISMLKEQGYRIAATSPHGDSIELADLDIETPTAFFFGTEKEGLSDEVLEMADVRIRIPMVGFTESLNISVSAAIILQDVTQRLRRSSVAWKLSEKEKERIRLEWTKKSVRSIESVMKRFENRD